MNLHTHYSSVSLRLPLHDRLLQFVSFDKTHSLRCTSKRDVLSDKMLLWGVTHFLFHALPVFFIKYCHKLCIQRQMVVRWRHVSYLLYGKYLERILLFPLHINSSLNWNWNFVMQLKTQSVEAWQNESIIQKRIPARTLSQDEKFSSRSTMWSTKVRSGHNILFVQLSPWAFKVSCYLQKLL